MANDTWIHPFLTALTATGVVASACRAVNISTTTAYALRRTDEGFRVMWDQALEDATDAMEAEARRRAIEGVEEPIVHKGQFTPEWARDATGEIVVEEYDTGLKTEEGKPILGRRGIQARNPDGSPRWLTVSKKSDALLMFLLKGYRQRFSTERTELTGADGAPLVIDSTKRAARVAALMALAAKRKEVDDLL